jgi:hypothetical protein
LAFGPWLLRLECRSNGFLSFVRALSVMDSRVQADKAFFGLDA